MKGKYNYEAIETGIPLQKMPSQDEGSDDEGESSKKHSKDPVFRAKIKEHDFSHYRAASYIALFFLAVTLSYIIIVITKNFSCLGAPYLYVTHGGSRNVMKFSRDGCLINPKVLWGVSDKNSELRGMFLGQYQNQEALYVADTGAGIQIFGSCFHDTSMRPLVGSVVTSDMNEGVQHPYSVKKDFQGNIYASFQHTDVVLRFHRETFHPMHFPRNLSMLNLKTSKGAIVEKKVPVDKKNPPEFYNGTFVQFGAPGLHNVTEQGIRDILWVNNGTELWIANEDIGGIAVVDHHGNFVTAIVVKNVIGLYSTDTLPWVFCSCKSTKTGAVYAINKVTKVIDRTYKVIGMAHPTALVSYGDVLFVGDQKRNVLMTFNMTSQRYIRQVVASSAMPGVIEQMILSDC